MALGDFLFPQLELTLTIVHDFEVDIAGVSDKMSKEYLEAAARVLLNENDMKRLKLKDGDTVSLESKGTTVSVQAFTRGEQPEGLAVMPRSPWAMALVPVPIDESTPNFHGISISVKKDKDGVTPLDDLLSSS